MPAKCQTVQMCLPLTALTLRWHCADFNCLFSWPWWRHRECSDPRDTRKQSTEYFTDTIVTMRVAKGVVDNDILVNNGSTSISRLLRDAAFCKCLYKFSDSFGLNSEYLNDFQLSLIQFLPMNYEIVGECSPTNMGSFECGDICGNRHKWERKNQRLAIMPAIRANASRSILVGSPPGGGLQLSTVRSRKIGDAGKPGIMVKTRRNIRRPSATPRMLSI